MLRGGFQKPCVTSVTYFVPTSTTTAATWHYVITADKPAANWYKADFDDGQWKTGKAPIGSGLPGSIAGGTVWNDTLGGQGLDMGLANITQP